MEDSDEEATQEDELENRYELNDEVRSLRDTHRANDNEYIDNNDDK